MTHTMMTYHTRHKGFTMMEMLVVIATFSLVIVAVAMSITMFYRANTSTVEQSFQVNSARRGMKLLVRDIREAIYSDEGSYPVVSIATSSFSFYSDFDRDASVELTRYFVSGTLLQKGAINATTTTPMYNPADEIITTVSDDVRNFELNIPMFRYFDDVGIEIFNTASVTDVAFVEMTLIVNVNPLQFPNEFTLRSSATLRNLKTNL